MQTENDKTLYELINQLSEKTTALLHQLRLHKMDKDGIGEMEKELQELQEKIQERMRKGE